MSRTFVKVAIIIAIIVVLAFAVPAFGKGGGKPPKPSTELGNNVSVPVIFAEGYNIVGGDVSTVGSGFRSTALIDNFADLTTYLPIQFLGVSDPITGDTVDLAGTPLASNWFYEQKKEATWQAQWVDATNPETLMNMVEVTRLDWGDSLLSKAWTVRSKIRLEIRLYRQNEDLQLQGYVMNHIAGSGIDEVWGAADSSDIGASEPAYGPRLYIPPEATVYSNCARLSLYKIQGLGDTESADDVEIFSMPVADKYGTDGPTGFGAEINVGGYVLYGYTLDAKAQGLAAGYYRVMFSLDDSSTWGAVDVSRNTVITGLDGIDDGTLSEWPFKSEMNTEGTASWVDIQIVAQGGGGKQ